jgi:hypothetical protein
MIAHRKGLCLFEIERSTGENYGNTQILVEHSCDAILRMMRGMKLAVVGISLGSWRSCLLEQTATLSAPIEARSQHLSQLWRGLQMRLHHF